MLINEAGDEIKDQDEILKEELRFYQSLNTQPVDHPNREQARNTFLEENIPTISDEDKTLCDEDISLGEIGIALKELKMEKPRAQTVSRQTFISSSGQKLKS